MEKLARKARNAWGSESETRLSAYYRGRAEAVAEAIATIQRMRERRTE
jgi:hypothetical protein